ncbi:sulfotransferase [Litorivivens sp.]|uniref:sulfotransferase family protein n=1 Tax=Litorivivens sp. TaxID=2020868 RepID=UPI003564BD20
MGDIRITDLAEPVLTDQQQAILDFGETLSTDFDPESILAEACSTLGLKDFGPAEFRERLDLLCDEWGNDEGLTGIGRFNLRNKLLTFAKSRLLIQDLLKRHPEIHAEEISEPIIVVGLPRTGTTHMLNLLAADSRLRSLPLWESYEPVPVPGEATLPDGTDPRYQRCADSWQAMQSTTPLIAAMHPMNPDHIHEELELQGPDFGSYNFEWLAHSPRWRDHYYATDQTPRYAYMKTVLKLLQWQDKQRLGSSYQTKRWVLKCPQHLEQLPVLMNTFPDATVVVTHRDPVAVIQSTITMLAYGQRMGRKKVLIQELADYWSERVAHLLQRCVEDRHLLAENKSIDSLFHEFMADDMGMVEKIYEKAGLELTDKARAQMRSYIDAHPRGKHGSVIYNLREDFGIDPSGLRQRFQFYFEKFPVRVEAR